MRLHTELGGDPSSNAYGEAWRRWQGWLADVRASGATDQAERADRVDGYMKATFREPTRKSATPAAVAGAAAVGGGVGYVVGSGGGVVGAISPPDRLGYHAPPPQPGTDAHPGTGVRGRIPHPGASAARLSRRAGLVGRIASHPLGRVIMGGVAVAAVGAGAVAGIPKLTNGSGSAAANRTIHWAMATIKVEDVTVVKDAANSTQYHIVMRSHVTNDRYRGEYPVSAVPVSVVIAGAQYPGSFAPTTVMFGDSAEDVATFPGFATRPDLSHAVIVFGGSNQQRARVPLDGRGFVPLNPVSVPISGTAATSATSVTFLTAQLIADVQALNAGQLLLILTHHMNELTKPCLNNGSDLGQSWRGERR